MRIHLRKNGALVAAAALLALGMSSCTSKITEEQLATIRDLRAQERRLTDEISRSESERARLDREIASRQADLRRCNDDKAFVQQQLAKWPNVWPDYTEPAPAPEPTTRQRRPGR